MITRFRVEGKGKDKQKLIEELSSAATKIIGVVGPPANGQWECTDDVISGDDNRGFQGRMVLRWEAPHAGH